MKHIVIASDHAGWDLKESVISLLVHQGYEVNDLGPETSESVDYPDYGISLAKEVSDGRVKRGIVICGTGITILRLESS